jgi:predicted  nucleic acid-binding Zn-ribbon protein
MLNENFSCTQQLNQEESRNLSKEQEELSQLRRAKQELKREFELSSNEVSRLTYRLDEVTRDRLSV